MGNPTIYADKVMFTMPTQLHVYDATRCDMMQRIPKRSIIASHRNSFTTMHEPRRDLAP